MYKIAIFNGLCNIDDVVEFVYRTMKHASSREFQFFFEEQAASISLLLWSVFEEKFVGV